MAQLSLADLAVQALAARRAAFEAWASDQKLALNRHHHSYAATSTAWCWDAWQAAQPAPAPPGWVLVPVEPTQAMCQEGQWKAQEWPKFPLRIAPIWKAMLAAAPAAMGT